MSRSTLALAAALLSLGVGCGKDAEPNGSERMIVRGTVAQLSVAQGARAVAVGADGRTVWANLDGHGDFTLRLPLGTSYRIVIANPRATAGHLVLGTGATSTRWIAARAATTIDLGRVSPITTTATTGGVRTQSSGAGELEGAESESDDDAKEHEDDAESHDGSESEVCSGGASDVELRASSEPADDVKDSAEHDDKDDDCNEDENESEDETDDD